LLWEKWRELWGITEVLVRFSAGIENVNETISDFKQELNKLKDAYLS
jgi:cystathionine beta-lyase/cystathionine gamma-synthase